MKLLLLSSSTSSINYQVSKTAGAAADKAAANSYIFFPATIET